MKFSSKPEAFSALIVLLSQFKQSTESEQAKQHLEECIRLVKTAMEDHEQNMENVLSSLSNLQSLLNEPQRETFITLIAQIRASDFRQTPQEQFENPLGRRFESEIAITLLTQPTQAMMYAVGRVSEELLKLIDDPDPKVQQILKSALKTHLFNQSSHVIALGAPEKTSLAEVKNLLQQNDPNKLAEIMHIHYKIAMGIIRDVPIHNAPIRSPVGHLATIVEHIYPGKPPQNFFSEVLSHDRARNFRSYISDNLFYSSSLYKAPGNRGRSQTEAFVNERTNQLGLMLPNQDETGLPKHFSSWAADCKCQPPDLTSPYVTDLIRNDGVYVAGPSGMTSLFLAQMEMVANFENEDLKKNYLSAVVAYIAGGGFHSIHEIIGPAQYALQLVPGYQVQAPIAGNQAPPPNYHHFFTQQASIDPEFAERHRAAWDKYTTYYSQHYAANRTASFTADSASDNSAETIDRFKQVVQSLQDKTNDPGPGSNFNP